MNKRAGIALAVVLISFGASGCGRRGESSSPASTLGSGVATTAAPITVLAATVTTSSTVADLTYTIQPGDSLSVIAEKFGVTTQALADFNSISDANSIKLGQTLRIPPIVATSTTAAG